MQPRFEQFHANIQLTPLQQADAYKKRDGAISCLNPAYYGVSHNSDHSFFVGSWDKSTTTRPPRDVDIYFLLPPAVYHRFQEYLRNKQSTLLQEVKNYLAATYPSTAISGNGQVVVIDRKYVGACFQTEAG